MENTVVLELEKGKDYFDVTAKENQNIVEGVSEAFANAVSKGIENVDIDSEYKDIVKSETKKTDFKKIGRNVGEAALRIGAKAIGINTTTFDNTKDLIEALKAGNVKEGLSSALDIGIDLFKGVPSAAKKLIKASKNELLGVNLDDEFTKIMEKQKNTISRLNKKCDKFDDALNKNDEKEMKKQVRLIKNDLDKVMLIENTISRARGIVNKYELMQNKNQEQLSSAEKELCEKLA